MSMPCTYNANVDPCMYCDVRESHMHGKKPPQGWEHIPELRDWLWWFNLRLFHGADCPWIVTRGFQALAEPLLSGDNSYSEED